LHASRMSAFLTAIVCMLALDAPRKLTYMTQRFLPIVESGEVDDGKYYGGNAFH
jgi:hypothetical protein